VAQRPFVLENVQQRQKGQDFSILALHGRCHSFIVFSMIRGYIPLTALNQFATNCKGPPLATSPPTIQARLHKPTATPRIATKVMLTFDTSVETLLFSATAVSVFRPVLVMSAISQPAFFV
jgi:hypothetical protein